MGAGSLSLKVSDLTDRDAVEDVIDAYTAGGNAGDDDQVIRWIREASDLLRSGAGREFYWQSGYTERTDARDAPEIFVRDHVPIDSISKIVRQNDPSTGGTTVDSDTYEAAKDGLGTVRRVHGVWLSTAMGRAGPVGGRQPGTEQPILKVTYDGGWKTPEQDTQGVGTRDLPWDVEGAVLSHVELKWHRNGQSPGVKSLSMADGSITYRGQETTTRMKGVADEYRLDRL